MRSGLCFPEVARLGPAGREAGGGGETGGSDHRGERVGATADGGPSQSGRQAEVGGELLGIEDRDRPMLTPGVDGGGDVVGSGGGRHDGAGCVEDGVDDQVQSLAGAGWPDDEDGVLDRCQISWPQEWPSR